MTYELINLLTNLFYSMLEPLFILLKAVALYCVGKKLIDYYYLKRGQ